MIDPAKTYRTRNGREVRIYAVDGSGMEPVHGAVKDVAGWAFSEWRADGKYYGEPESSRDLIEVKPKHVRWVNVYDNRATVYDAKGAAETNASRDRLACIRIEFEEGEGL